MHAHPDLLDHFGFTDNDFLGAGSESAVYAYSNTQIIRFYGSNDSRQKIETLKEFYDHLAQADVPFKMPQILSHDSINGRFYSKETRLSGKTLIDIMPTLSESQREEAIKQFVYISSLISSIHYPQDKFGEILTDYPIRDKTWEGYLIQRIERTLANAYDIISLDVPEVETLFGKWKTLLPMLGSVSPQLVHGDFYWGNVLGDDLGQLTAVLDFSPMTVMGDWRLDLVTSKIFLELTPNVVPKDIQLAKAFVDEILGVDSSDIEQIYRIYYAFYYSFTIDSDPPLYHWCVEQLIQFKNEG